MTLYPDVQKKAQDEIDEYFSANKEDVRILNVADRENLPFTKALASEVLRWHPVTNVAVHNSGEKEEHIRGYRIPPGTMVIANIWAMLHDSTVYENPAEFDPNRFLSDRPAPDPALYAFGFGRRSCPGMHLGQQLLWLTISNILAHFTTSKALDDQGNEITPSEEYTTTSVLRFVLTHYVLNFEFISDVVRSRPMPFKCSITARSSDSMSFVRSVEA
ncbi:hypothetical protein FRC08_008300 [Ceratobasidium sp. 394]|nr:hypothetical protein FRC08_008300 [Ceratobasidium sp. 394]